MAAKNAENTIQQSLRSLVKSIGADAEIAVWNDCSTDSTEKIVERMATLDSRIKLFGGSAPLGAGLARNNLVDLTDSEFIANLDSDDIALPDRFRTQLRLMEKFDAVFSTTIAISEQTLPIGVGLPLSVSQGSAGFRLIANNPFPNSSMFTKRNLFDAVGGFMESSSGEDYGLWIKMHLKGARMGRIARPLVCYRSHSGQTTRMDGQTYMSRLSVTVHDLYRDLVLSLVPGIDFENITGEEFLYVAMRAAHELPFADRAMLHIALRRSTSLPVLLPGWAGKTG